MIVDQVDAGDVDQAADLAIAESDLIHRIRDGLKRLNESVREIGAALDSLRKGPHGDLTREQWDTYLRGTFGLSVSTASKFTALANFEAPDPADTVSIWKQLPASWTSQYAIVSGMEPDRIATAVDAGIIHPAMTGDEVSTMVRQAKGKPSNTEPPKKTVRFDPWDPLYELSTAIPGKLADDAVEGLGKLLGRLLKESQRQRLRELLAA